MKEFMLSEKWENVDKVRAERQMAMTSCDTGGNGEMGVRMEIDGSEGE